jgi:hypothetical protein
MAFFLFPAGNAPAVALLDFFFLAGQFLEKAIVKTFVPL